MATMSTGILHQGVYEVHLPVTDLGKSVDFYAKLGFELGFGSRGDSSVLLVCPDATAGPMIGLFTVDAVEHRHPAEFHTAFRVAGREAERMVPWLRKRGIEPQHPSTAPRDGPMDEPIVHGWMPAAAVFFEDPDGHLLELIAELDGEPQPAFNYRPLSEWRCLRDV